MTIGMEKSYSTFSVAITGDDGKKGGVVEWGGVVLKTMGGY